MFHLHSEPRDKYKTALRNMTASLVHDNPHLTGLTYPEKRAVWFDVALELNRKLGLKLPDRIDALKRSCR